MLEKTDLTKKISKTEFKSVITELEIKLNQIQLQSREYGIPIIIVFEGWDAAGKESMINRILLALDPRGFTVYPINPPTDEEKLKPFLWRFWTKTPERGRIAIFDQSWYGRILIDRVDKKIGKQNVDRINNEINIFEKQLVHDGTVIIKFFLHISKQEQKRRFKDLLNNPATAWKVTDEDWAHHKQYKKYVHAIEEMLAGTDTEYAHWTIVEAHCRRYATIKIFNTILNAVEHELELRKNKSSKIIVERTKIALLEKQESILDRVDLSLSISREDYEQALKKYQEKIRDLAHEVFIKKLPVVIVYQGWDAAGKGGNIKRLVTAMDPRGYEVVSIGAPNDLEKSHHYLWRFWLKAPKAGHITVFDRSWYGRILVERIEGFCTEEEWRRAYREINEMEEQWLNCGIVIIKFWLHIDPEEQLRRFKAREETPHKHWKINAEDWRNREKWDQYKIAVDDMLRKTSTNNAPWTIVEANCKLYARLKTLKTVISQIEAKMK